MINLIKEKGQDNIFHKMGIFAMIWILIYLALGISMDCIGAILYVGYYFPNINFINGSSSLFANGVVETSLGVSFLIFMGCLFYYFYINFEKFKTKKGNKISN